MAYCTQQDLIERFGAAELVQLTDRTNKPATTIDATTVSRHVDDASSIIDGYVGKVYDLPLTVVPGALLKVACDISRYFLHGKAAEKDSPVQLNYLQAMSWLRDVAKGLIAIEVGGTEPPQVEANQVQTNEPERPLTADSMRGYI